jgi:hypothetical protein
VDYGSSAAADLLVFQNQRSRCETVRGHPAGAMTPTRVWALHAALSDTHFGACLRGHGWLVPRVLAVISTYQPTRISMKKRHLLALALIPALLVACGGSDDSFDDRADLADPKVRLVHVIPGAPNVSLFRDNVAQSTDVTNMPYKGASNYFDTNEDVHTWDVRTASAPIVTVGSENFETHRGNKYTLIAVPDAGSVTDVALIADPFNKSLTSDDARVRVFNAAFNAANIDVYLTAPNVNIANAGPNFPGVNYKQAIPASGADSVDMEGGSYVLRVTTAGTKTVLFTAQVTIPEDADWLLVPVPNSLVPGDMHVLVVQSDLGAPATELTNQP